MMRVLAISLGLLLGLSVLLSLIVFGKRRSFPADPQIVFEMGRQNYILYAIHPNSSLGENLHTLFLPQRTFEDRFVTGVDCAPDSRSLIFWYIYLYRFDLRDEALTQLVLGAGLSQQSVWSPDGTQIAFIDDTADGMVKAREIFTINADGSGKTQVTYNEDQETSLSWSPDGTRIAFTYRTSGDQGLAMVDVASGTAAPIYETRGRMNNASWSPDGTRIAFDLSDGERADIYSVSTNGSDLTRLTREAQFNILPRWSPDGSMISFSSRRTGGHYELYVMDSDGGNPTLVFWSDPNADVFNRCWLG